MSSSSKKNRNLRLNLLVDFALSFMLCIFAPIDAFCANISEFWFSLGQMMSVCGIVFIILWAALSLISFFISKTGIKGYYLLVKAVILLYLYIQGNFIPRDYGVMNGAEIDWGSYFGYAVASILLFAVCVGIYIVLIKRFKSQVGNIVKYAVLFVLGIQLVTICVLVMRNGVNSTDETVVVTSKNLMDFSEDRNVIVVLLDTYEGNDLSYLLETDNDDQSDIFENFTFYRDTLGSYPTTRCALPQILTGRYYKNELPYADFVDNAYVDNEIYDELEKNDFVIDMYTNPVFLSKDADMYENVTRGTYYIKDIAGFAANIYKMVAFNYMPHQIKKMFVYDTETFSGLMETTDIDEAFDSDNFYFLNKLNEYGVSASKKGNLFKFYHLAGVHYPYTFGSGLTEDGGEYTSYDEAAGCDEILKDLFEKLRNEGIYDNSTIIVMADHGHNDYSQNPVFLIKNTDEHHEFTVSDKEVSYDYLDDIWMSLADGEVIDEKYVGSLSLGEDRDFIFYSWDDAWDREFMPGMEEMICTGEAWDADNLTTTGVTYNADNEKRDYSLGERLEFIAGRNGYTYVPYGISWSNVKCEAMMAFDIVDEFENLSVEIELADSCGVGNVAFYANEHLVAEQYYDCDMGKLSFMIPGEYIEDGRLLLKMVQDVESGAKDPLLVKSQLDINSMVIESTDKTVNIEKQINSCDYDLGKKLIFKADRFNAGKYYCYGFNIKEDWGTWTEGNESKLKFNVGSDKDLILDMVYTVFDGPQNVEIYIDDRLLEYYVAEGDSVTHSVEIPKDYMDGEYLEIVFKLPDAHSPASSGEGSEDIRVLGLGFETLSISER